VVESNMFGWLRRTQGIAWRGPRRRSMAKSLEVIFGEGEDDGENQVESDPFLVKGEM